LPVPTEGNPDEPALDVTSYEWGEYVRLRRRLEYTPYVLAYGYREGDVTPTDATIGIDGRLDEAAWRSAKASLPFVRPAWGRKETPEDLAEFEPPREEATRLKLLYGKTHLYVGIEMSYSEKPAIPSWAQKQWRGKRPGERVNFAWRVPCIELLFDTTGGREHYHHLVSNIAGLWVSTHCRAYATEKTGGWWKPDWEFRFNLGEKSGSFEASIPLADLAESPPQQGTAWGFQAYRSKIGPFTMQSGVYDLVGGEHRTRQSGRIEHRVEAVAVQHVYAGVDTDTEHQRENDDIRRVDLHVHQPHHCKRERKADCDRQQCQQRVDDRSEVDHDEQ